MPERTEPVLVVGARWVATVPSGRGQRILDATGSKAVFCCVVVLPQAPKPGSRLEFQGIDDDGIIYVNGVRLGETHDWRRTFDFDAAGFRAGQNVVDVFVHNRDGIGGLTGAVTLDEPLGASI